MLCKVFVHNACIVYTWLAHNAHHQNHRTICATRDANPRTGGSPCIELNISASSITKDFGSVEFFSRSLSFDFKLTQSVPSIVLVDCLEAISLEKRIKIVVHQRTFPRNSWQSVDRPFLVRRCIYKYICVMLWSRLRAILF